MLGILVAEVSFGRLLEGGRLRLSRGLVDLELDLLELSLRLRSLSSGGGAVAAAGRMRLIGRGAASGRAAGVEATAASGRASSGLRNLANIGDLGLSGAGAGLLGGGLASVRFTSWMDLASFWISRRSGFLGAASASGTPWSAASATARPPSGNWMLDGDAERFGQALDARAAGEVGEARRRFSAKRSFWKGSPSLW
jgi:hypothetical protein